MPRLLVYLLLAIGGLATAHADGLEQSLEPLLRAEFASQQGDLASAARDYAVAAGLSTDSAVARRALQMALAAEQIGLARQGLARWAQLDPQAEQLDVARLRLALLADEVEPARAALAQLLARPSGWRDASAALATAPRTGLPTVLLQGLLDSGQMPAELDGWMSFGAVALRRDERALYARLARAAGERFPDQPRALLWQTEEALARKDEAAARRILAIVAALPGLDRIDRLTAAVHFNALGDPAAAAALLAPLADDDQAVAARAIYLQTAHDQAGLDGLYEQTVSGTDAAAATPARVLLLGQLAEMREDFEAALAWYRQVADGPQRDQAHLRMAVLLDRRGSTAEALDLLRELQASDSDWGDLVRDAYLLEAELSRRHGDGPSELAALDRGLAIFEDDALLRYNRALAYERVDQVDAAVADLRALVAADPEEADWLNALGYTLVDRTDALDEGLALIERAHALKPGSAAISDSLGWALHRLGRDAEALPHLERAFAQQRDAEIASHLVAVLAALGQIDEARSMLRLVRELEPDNRSLQRLLPSLPGELVDP